MYDWVEGAEEESIIIAAEIDVKDLIGIKILTSSTKTCLVQIEIEDYLTCSVRCIFATRSLDLLDVIMSRNDDNAYINSHTHEQILSMCKQFLQTIPTRKDYDDPTCIRNLPLRRPIVEQLKQFQAFLLAAIHDYGCHLKWQLH
eukprot:TRINITY_DN14597_c0_g1_i1.p1 TRINITY_DN14597_c0_g1~~TRINITY_DN14597_c0_g1_i1.p1  ORF type:complete len:144 (+),score=16.75 TRINITY_DN14597_c0_g1_i1:1-432(+)